MLPSSPTPDKSKADIPSHEQVRRAWNVVNAELWEGFEKQVGGSDWLARHTAVSEEDFRQRPSRNRGKRGPARRAISQQFGNFRSRASQHGIKRTRKVSITGEKCASREYNTRSRVLCAVVDRCCRNQKGD